MKLGYVGIPNRDPQFKGHEHLTLADRLNFHQAYFPKTTPQHFIKTLGTLNSAMKITLDAAAFGARAPSEVEAAVRLVNDQLGGQLSLGIEMSGANADPKSKAQSQAFETLFSYDSGIEQIIPTNQFPMRRPRPDIIGLPVTGAYDEARRAAACGYSPMTPSWLPEKDVARVWPAIVNGATSAVRRARPTHWQVNRMIVVHDDRAVLTNYIHGPNSPYRRYFLRLAQQGLIDADVDRHIKRVVITGSHRKVAEDILALRETVGDFGTLNIVDPSGSDPNMTQHTMVRLAKDVMPMVATSNVSPLKNLEKT